MMVSPTFLFCLLLTVTSQTPCLCLDSSTSVPSGEVSSATIFSTIMHNVREVVKLYSPDRNQSQQNATDTNENETAGQTNFTEIMNETDHLELFDESSEESLSLLNSSLINETVINGNISSGGDNSTHANDSLPADSANNLTIIAPQTESVSRDLSISDSDGTESLDDDASLQEISSAVGPSNISSVAGPSSTTVGLVPAEGILKNSLSDTADSVGLNTGSRSQMTSLPSVRTTVEATTVSRTTEKPEQTLITDKQKDNNKKKSEVQEKSKLDQPIPPTEDAQNSEKELLTSNSVDPQITASVTSSHPDYVVQTVPYTTQKAITGPERSVQCLLQPEDELSLRERANVVTLYLAGPKVWSVLEKSQFCKFLTGIVSEAVKDSTLNTTEADRVTVVFLDDRSAEHRLSFFAWNAEGEVIPGSFIRDAVEAKSDMLESETEEEVSEVMTNVFYRPVRRGPLDNPVLATAVITAVVTVCIVAAGSLCVLICWHRYKRRYHGEWIVNKQALKGDKLDTWCYDNDAFFGVEDKQLDGSYVHHSFASSGRSPSAHSGFGMTEQASGGWLVPKEMMEMVEKGHIKQPY